MMLRVAMIALLLGLGGCEVGCRIGERECRGPDCDIEYEPYDHRDSPRRDRDRGRDV